MTDTGTPAGDDARDTALDAALALALAPEAEDVAPLSQAVLTRLAEDRRPAGSSLAEVLTDPLPASGLLFGGLLLAGALGYALAQGEMQEVVTLYLLVGQGF